MTTCSNIVYTLVYSQTGGDPTTQEAVTVKYVILNNYVGPNRSEHRDYYAITSTPQRTNMSHEERIEGWLGTTNDWSVQAMGEFETIDAAREAITGHNENARQNWRTSGVDDPDQHDEITLEVWPVADTFDGALITVDWDDPSENLEFTLADGVVFLYSEGPEGREYHDAWRAAAEALADDEDDASEFAKDSENRDAIIEYLEGQGWTVEHTSHDGWDCEWIVGRPAPKAGC